jgi:hypothetical protein
MSGHRKTDEFDKYKHQYRPGTSKSRLSETRPASSEYNRAQQEDTSVEMEEGGEVRQNLPEVVLNRFSKHQKCAVGGGITLFVLIVSISKYIDTFLF